MSDKFFLDLNGTCFLYSDLFERALSKKTFNQYCRGESIDIFCGLLQSLVLDKPITLLDLSFSDDEIKNLVGVSDLSKYTEKTHEIDVKKALKSFKNGTFLQFLRLKNWKITLFTSGSEGRPKKVEHSFSSIFKDVRISEKHKKDIWGFAYNPTHMAGLQVFMQAFLNQNFIVDLFEVSATEAFKRIDKECISHISATPTFFRMLCGSDKSFKSVVRLTSGGERFDIRTMQKLQKNFVNAKVLNVYASTEYASMLVSNGEFFELSENMRINNNELFVFAKLNSEQPQWHSTGDIIEFVDEQKKLFRFCSRKSDMINVGGYKVNPSEVEDVIRCIDGVRDVSVYALANSVLGNIVASDILIDTDLSEADIRKALQGILQNFKIPRVIKFVESIEKTRTGKIKKHR